MSFSEQIVVSHLLVRESGLMTIVFYVLVFLYMVSDLVKELYILWSTQHMSYTPDLPFFIK